MLRNSELVMYGRRTESWARRFVGGILGAKPTVLPGWLEARESFRARNPEELVMARPAGHLRPYGSNPCGGHDHLNWPFLHRGAPPPHDVTFAFAFHAFHPEGRWMIGADRRAAGRIARPVL